MTRTPRSRRLEPPQFRPRITPAPVAAAARATAAARQLVRAMPGWRILVADSAEARIYAADGAITSLKLLATLRNPSARKPERELVSARQGRKFNRSGGVQQSLSAPGSWHRASTEQFAKTIALVAGRQLARDERLVLVAAPRLLGLVERALPAGARKRLARTVPRDVVHEGAAELRARLRKALVELR
jgi:protein required for attachment to host cells